MTQPGPIRQRSSPELPTGEDWPDYRHHILGSLQRLELDGSAQLAAMGELKLQLAVLQTKMSLLAAAIALAVSLAVEVVSLLLRR